MRIDPKYFNRFILIAALIAALLIVVFTLWNQESREHIFRKRLDAMADSIGYRYMNSLTSSDSVRIQQFKGEWVVLAFWATWAPQSRQSHRILNRLKEKYPRKMQVLAATSQDPVNEVRDYANKHEYPFYFLDGKSLYRDVNPPGVPTQVIFGPKGDIRDVIIGYKDSSQYNKFRNWLSGRSDN